MMSVTLQLGDVMDLCYSYTRVVIAEAILVLALYLDVLSLYMRHIQEYIQYDFSYTICMYAHCSLFHCGMMSFINIHCVNEPHMHKSSLISFTFCR